MEFLLGDSIDHQMMAVLFKSLDADSDGKLSMTELMSVLEDKTSEAALQPFFEACDQDGDKRITLEEFQDFCIAMDNEWSDSSEEEEEETTGGGMTEGTVEKLFKSLDGDGDGTLVMKDLRALVDAEGSDADMQPFFDACDTNGDKKITLEEFKAFYKGMGEDKKTTEGDKKKPEEDTVKALDDGSPTHRSQGTLACEDVRRATLLNIHRMLQDLDKRVADDYLTLLQHYQYDI